MKSAARTIVICPFATPNGPLHAGHLAGPYLAGDVYARYLRAGGREVVFPMGTDDNQTYVATVAAKRGITPAELLAESAGGVRRGLEAAGISTDGFVPAAPTNTEEILRFLVALREAGKLVPRDVPLPYSRARGEFLLDGLVTGECPNCLDTTCGGICETCGHPVDYAVMRELTSTLDPADPVVLRDTPVLVLPMEDYRRQLAEFHANRPYRWRPGIEQLILDLLDRPLLDLPITYPISRGIPAPFAETPGQVINPWAEAMAQCMHGTWYVQRDEAAESPGADERVDRHWLASTETELVYFLGFDNAANWAMTYLALLMAHGERYLRPSAIVCNEFYELDHAKFSTSRGHAVWATDLMSEVPRDAARFYLALTSPEHRGSNFHRRELATLVTRRLIEPWNALGDALGKACVGLEPGAVLEVGAQGRRRAAVLAARLRSNYELPRFSIARAAESVVGQLERLRVRADRMASRPHRTELADLLFEVRTLFAFAAPILVDAAARGAAGGVDLAPEPGGSSVPVFALPRLEPLIDEAEAR